MPYLADIEVTVTVDGISKTDRKIRQSLTEWGNCSTRGQSRISTYIEAQTGKQFTIRIQANIPAISKAAAVDDDELEADVGHDLSASMITMNSTTLRGRGIGEENTWRQGMTSQA
ncbi:hypothetical protein MMC13_002707 [Lambiella insularis]|nr:hypothetical protein [Lambiella insularis]